VSGISAVVLSWKRAANVPAILDSFGRWPAIRNVLIWNNNPDMRLDLPVQVINSPQNYSCLARYCAAPLMQSDTIWFQDDDVVLTPDQFEKIYRAFRQDPSRIYGCRGRNIENGRYQVQTVYGECDIVIGQTMLFKRNLLTNFFSALFRISTDLIEDDIVFSLSCGRRHFAVDVEPLREVGWDDEAALWRRPDHFARRQKTVDLMHALKSATPQSWG